MSDSETTPATAPNGLVPDIKFCHAEGHYDASRQLSDLLRGGSRSIRGAVCFLTGPGGRFLKNHAMRLRSADSFFVASIDPPTDLDALCNLHFAAPGHIYIHLGGKTPEARDMKNGRSLMHSKVLLAHGDDGYRLWVGSHNMTAAAIAGGNIEAGIEIMAPDRSECVRDAEEHLEVCRATAELFDPAQMGRYKEIQDRRRRPPPEIEKAGLLVIHAESDAQPSAVPFTVLLLMAPTDFDAYFTNDREVRLFLHPSGSLAPGRPVDSSRIAPWQGVLTGVVRTTKHHNTGIGGTFPAANYELAIPDQASAPRLVAPGSAPVAATSQITIRIDSQGAPDEEVYSLASRPISHELESESGGREWHEVPDEFWRCFTAESVDDGRLIYRAVTGLRQIIRIEGYEDTMRPIGEQFNSDQRVGGAEMLFTGVEPELPIQNYFYLTKHVVRRRPQ